MDPLNTTPDLPDSLRNPPGELKVFAPNGDTKVFRGWIGVRKSPRSLQLAELFIMEDKAERRVEVINKKAVVQNLGTGEVIYDPRRAPDVVPGLGHLITGSEKLWLKDHPHWPAILELYGDPVEDEGGEENGGGIS